MCQRNLAIRASLANANADPSYPTGLLAPLLNYISSHRFLHPLISYIMLHTVLEVAGGGGDAAPIRTRMPEAISVP